MSGKYDYLEKSQVIFEWFVPEKVFVTGKTLEDLMFIIPNLGKGGIEDTYNPFEENPTLFIEFLNLPPTPREIGKFIQKWGTLRGGGVWVEPEEFEYPALSLRNGKPWEDTINREEEEMMLDVYEPLSPSAKKAFISRLTGKQEEIEQEKTSTPQQKESPTPRYEVLHYESFDFWMKQIWDMARTFQAWKIVEERDIALLHRVAIIAESQKVAYGNLLDGFFLFTNLPREVILSFRDNEEFLKKTVEGNHQDIDLLRSHLPKGVPLLVWSRNWLRKMAVSEDNLDDLLFDQLMDLITLKVNHTLRRGVYPVLYNEKGRFTTYLKPRDLLSALWLQFYFVLVGERRIKRCSVCGLWEDVTDKTKGWSKHHECSQRERFRKYYEKVKEVRELHRQGKTPEEIASLLGKSVEWVEKQLKKEGESDEPAGQS
ncbi:MAG: hypothetical protein HPY68_04915 [Candidatus Atribacteria bacterium]|nr:hypothetical protein [Candidatus Atribacteria bacterium]